MRIMVSVLGVLAILTAGAAQAQSWTATPTLPPNAQASCPKIPAYAFTLSGDQLTLLLPTGTSHRTAVGADGSAKINFMSAMPGAGEATVSGNARAKDMQLTYVGLPSCIYALKASTSGQAGTLEACDQTISYSIEAPGAAVPANLKAFSGVWLGNLALMCAGVVFERVDDPNAVQFVLFNGRWSASGGAVSVTPKTLRIVGKFDGNNRIWTSGGQFQTEFILRSPQELTYNSTGSFTNTGTLKRR
jgi:hypothetical protein